MKFLYKSVMFLMLLLFCVGSVCAADNTTSDNVTADGGLSPVNPPINNTNNVKNITDKYIGHLMTPEEQFEFMNEIYKNNTALQKSNKQFKKDINNLNDKIELQNKVINSQNNTINILNNRVKALEEDNKQLNIRLDKKDIEIKELKLENENRIKELKLENENRIKELKLENENRIKELKLENENRIKELKLENENRIKELKLENENRINELNSKLDLQLIEIKGLQAVKDKLQADKDKLYEQLLNSPKKEDFDQLKKEIDNKNKQIDKLNNEINILNSILSVSKNDVCNSLKGLSSTKNIKTIKCGSYTFKLEDYLKIPLIKDGKNRVLKYKKKHGRLPNYVEIAGIKVYPKVYKKLYNL